MGAVVVAIALCTITAILIWKLSELENRIEGLENSMKNLKNRGKPLQ